MSHDLKKQLNQSTLLEEEVWETAFDGKDAEGKPYGVYVKKNLKTGEVRWRIYAKFGIEEGTYTNGDGGSGPKGSGGEGTGERRKRRQKN